MQHIRIKKVSMLFLSLILLLISLSGCASQSNRQMDKGHDIYYSSNVDPRFQPSYPPGDNGMSMQQMNGMQQTDGIQQQTQQQQRGNTMNSQSYNQQSNLSGSSFSDLHNGTMMNGQVMNDQQRRIMDEIMTVPGVNDARIIVNNKNIVVGIDVNNVGERARVVNDVKELLQNVHRGYQVSVTAERAMYDRIYMLRQSENSIQSGTNDDHNLTENYSFMEDFEALLKDIGDTITEPLR